MIKTLLKKLLGRKFLFRIKEFRRTAFPTAMERQEIEREQKFFARLKTFYSQFVSQGDLCFDVGANLGNRIEPLLSIGARVVAFEPQNVCCEYLRAKFGSRIILIQKGVGASPSKQKFFLSNNLLLSSFSPEWIDSVEASNRFAGTSKWDKVVEMEITTLDVSIAKYGIPAFIKIDVEGFELEVLKGLTNKIKMISFEYTTPEQVGKIVECLKEIEKHSTDLECNYSVKENMKFELNSWINISEMKEYVLQQEFIETELGDIYVREVVC